MESAQLISSRCTSYDLLRFIFFSFFSGGGSSDNKGHCAKKGGQK
jgi:hypothetical protein